MAGGPVTTDIRGRSARLCRFVTGMSVVLWGLLVLERFSEVAIQLSMHGVGGEPLRRLGYELVLACPDVFYLLALWGIRQALAEFARGELYAPAVTRMLDRVGVMLVAGAFAKVLLVPGAARLLGFGPGYWVAFDVSGLVLAAVGLALTVIARVLKQASRMQAELDGIF